MLLTNELMLAVDEVCRRNGAVRVTKVAWALACTAAALEAPLKAYKALMAPTPAIQGRERARIALLEAHATRDAQGQVIKQAVAGQPDLVSYAVADAGAYAAALEALLAAHPQAALDDAALVAQRPALLAEAHEFTPHALAIGDVPDDTLTAADMGVLRAAGILTD
jgi:hypothetical protein